MSTIKQFEELYCWQKARELTKEVYKICRNVDISKSRNADISQDWGFRDQIQRASVSIMSNIAEGFERGTKQELINYFYIAKGSCAEVRCQIYIAYDVGYIDMSKCRYICGLADEVGRLIESFVQKVKSASLSGLQYKHISKSRNIPSHLKDFLDSNPDYREYYNEKLGQIEFWRIEEDKKKKF